MSLKRIAFLLCFTLASSTLAVPDVYGKNRKPPKPEHVFPLEVQRPVDAVLADFRVMMTAYGHGPIIMELEYIGNQTGSDKLPTDLSQYGRNIYDKMGISAYRALPEAFDTPRYAGASLPQMLRKRPDPPPLTFRLVGSLQRATETESKDRSGRLDLMFGGGRTPTDGSITVGRGSNVTALTIALSLERPDGTTVTGASTEYRRDVVKSERGNTVSLYLGGTGGSLGSVVTITQESGDALYETIAMGIMHVMGNALQVPFHRLSPHFREDPGFEKRVRNWYEGLSQADLERQLKYFMIVNNFVPGGDGADLTNQDRAVLQLELQHRRIESRGRDGMTEFLMQLWENMDYRGAARRIQTLSTLIARNNNERRDQQAREQASLVVKPSEFGWPETTKMMVLDLTRIVNTTTREQMLSKVRSRLGYSAIQQHPQKPGVFGIRSTWQRSDLQYSLDKGSPHFQFIWLETPSPRLLLHPMAN